MEEEEFIWTTRGGKHIPLSKIGDQHLRNIERMMRREMFAAERASCMMQGEAALLTIDSDISGMEYDYGIICKEIKRRGLPPPQV